MIRKHWMLRDYDPRLVDYSQIVDEVNSFGYNSLLLTVYPRSYDMWTIAANTVNDSHSFKYMMAVRPYLYSPQYLAMLVASFNRIAKDRLILNMVHGSLTALENFDGLMEENIVSDNLARKTYMDKFLSKFTKDVQMSVDFPMPEIILSGQSDEVVAIAKKNSFSLAVWKEMLDGDREKILGHGIKKLYVSSYVLVTDTDEEAQDLIRNLPGDQQSSISLYGSKETVKEKIRSLNTLGVTDMLFSQYGPNPDRLSIHECLQELTEEGVLQ